MGIWLPPSCGPAAPAFLRLPKGPDPRHIEACVLDDPDTAQFVRLHFPARYSSEFVKYIMDSMREPTYWRVPSPDSFELSGIVVLLSPLDPDYLTDVVITINGAPFGTTSRAKLMAFSRDLEVLRAQKLYEERELSS